MDALSKKQQTPMDAVLSELYETLDSSDPTSQEYTKLIKDIETLERLKLEIKSKSHPSSDAILGAVASFAGILTLLVFEINGHMITSKAFSLLPKGSKH